MTSPGPRRFIPDDADFTRSIQLIEGDACDMRSIRAAALATLPTPVSAEECYRMWIPAPDVVAHHNIDEILQSLAGSQVQTWKDARPQVRDFVRIPKHGISFVCTSLATCHTLGGLSLKICGYPVKIRKYSRYDKWYYVDLTRLPLDISDSDIYDWFCDVGAQPVLITPKYQASGLTSRDRTVFFPQVPCPDALFVDEKTPVREIFFTEKQESPCFVYHRNRALNKFTPPSLKKAPKPKRHIDLSEEPADKADETAEDIENGEPESDDAHMEGAEDPANPGAQDNAAVSLPPAMSQRTIIVPRVDAATMSEWKLVQTSKHGLIASNPIPEPTSLTPCELVDEGDEFSLKYSLAVAPNYYDVLVHEYLDDATSPDVDIEVKSADGLVLNGFTAESPLLPLHVARSLTNARHHKHKVEHMSLAELTAAIDTYLVKDFAGLLSGNHEDALAAVKAQPAYHRRIFSLKDDEQMALVQQHAVFRALMTTRYDNGSFSFKQRIEHKYGQEHPPMVKIFEQIFPTAPEQETAYSYALVDLLLMIMAPSIYLDPVKVQILLPPQLEPRRLRFSPFLLWSDITLVYMAQTDVCATFLKHSKIPQHVKIAIRAVKDARPASLADAWIFRSVSINANGLNQSSGAFFDQVLRRYQLIALQETKFNKPDKRQSAEYFVHTSDPTARCFWSHTTTSVYNGRHGVGLVLSTTSPFRDPVDVSRSVMNPTLQNRYLLVQSMLGEYPIYIHVVYAPDEPAQRGEFFRALPTDFAPEAEHIVIGDFNVTMDDNLDQRVPGHQAGIGREELRDWVLNLGLLDAWRFHHPDKREYTSPKDRNRIDFCFLSVRLLQGHLQDISHVIGPKWQHEDHKPVDFLLSSVNVPRMKTAPWRCPTWLLRDAETVEYLQASVENLADRIRIFNGANPGCLLDEHKRSDCKWLRQRFTTLRNADTEEHKRLHRRLQDLKLQYDIRPTEANQELCTAARLALKAYQEAIQFRNQRRKFEADLHQGEKATKHFFVKPVPDAMMVPIPGVKLEDGSVSSDPIVIAQVQRRYWGKLFQSPSEDLKQRKSASYSPIDLATYLQHTLARLTATQRAALDAPMTANDFYWAIQTSKNDKAPGPDGLPAEYYKLSASTWAWIYEAVYASQLEKGRMTKFQRRAHLSLLYKAGDRCEPSNYRPLTLLNHDAKFGPKILARRLGGVIPSIVDDDQSGFVPGRSIRHALLRFQDVQRYCQEHYPDAGAILLDFAKAFDSVLWPALDMVLQHFGFGNTFRDWVKTFYSGTLVSILVSGAPGRPFELGAGVRQGDPLSPGLFVVFIEPMLNFLRARLGSDGVKIGNSEPHLTLAFADDCTGLLRDLRDAPRFLETVQMYATAAGLKLNVAKTNILPFSRHVRNSTLETLSSLGVKVVSSRETVKLLGVLQGATVTAEERFAPILQQMRQRCVLWKYRARTLQGRIVILQSVILPLLWYTASVTVVPKAVLAAVDIIIRNFVNNNDQVMSASPGKLPKEWIHVSKVHGGLGLAKPVVFTRATHLTCLRDGVRSTIVQHRVPRWFEPALHFFNASLQGLGQGFDILYADIPKSRTRASQWSALPEYWYETLLTWRRLHEVAGISHRKLTSQVMPLWSNFWYLFGTTNRPAHKLSKHSVSLAGKGYLRLQDFVDRHSSLPTAAVLTSVLGDYEGFARPASKTLFVNETLRRLGLLFDDTSPRFGPHFPRQVEAAHHPWTFSCRSGSEKAFIRMTNAEFSRLLGETRPIPMIPYAQLSVEAPSNISDVWKQDYRANRHLLPVFADLKFRLQHNALGFRYKFKWHTDVVLASTCVHGCEVDENAKHLFWDCTIAKHQWEWYLRPLQDKTTERLTWKDVLFADSVKLTNQALKDIGIHNFAHVFNIVRGCVMRTLWLHRNNKMYNSEVSSSALFVQHHASNYVELHLKWLQRFAEKKTLPRLERFATEILMQLELTRGFEDTRSSPLL